MIYKRCEVKNTARCSFCTVIQRQPLRKLQYRARLVGMHAHTFAPTPDGIKLETLEAYVTFVLYIGNWNPNCTSARGGSKIARGLVSQASL